MSRSEEQASAELEPGLPGWRLRLFGACELMAPDGAPVQLPQRKALALLAYVERQSERRAMRERLAALLWDHTDSAQARLNLRKTLSSIRQGTGADQRLAIQTVGDVIAIEASDLTSDASEFEAILQDKPVTLERLRQAADLYRGEFLGDFSVRNASEFDHWMLIERQRLREKAIGVLCQLMEHEEEQADARASAALRLLALDPLQEAAHRALMRQLTRQGRYSAALKHYHGLVDLLARELGSQPEPATQQLFREISQSRQARGESLTETPAAKAASVEVTSELAEAPGGPEAATQDPAPVSAPEAEAPYPGPSPRKRQVKMVAAMSAGLLALALAGGALWHRASEQAADKTETVRPVSSTPSVAVLPFSIFGAGADVGRFADGLTEEVINSLVQVSNLNVTGRTSSFHFKDQNLDLREIGRRLGVGYIVEGSVRQTGNRLRVTAQLINVENGFHLWSETYDRTLNDVFAIQEDIADKVASELEARLSTTPGEQHLRFSPENYRTYLLALSYLRSPRQDDLEAARTLFDRLRTAEPDNAHVHAGYVLATVKLERAWLSVGFDTTRAEVQKSAKRALEAAPDLSEAYLAQGLLEQFLAMNYGLADNALAAEAALRRAVELGPRNASAVAAYGEILSFLGRFEEASGYLKRAVQLDPLATAPRLHLGDAYEGMEQPERALGEYLSLLESHPEFGPAKFRIARLKLRLGKLDEAELWARDSFQKDRSPVSGMLLANIYTNLGMEEQANKVYATLSEADYFEPVVQAVKYIGAGEYRLFIDHCKDQLGKQQDPLWISGIFTAAVLMEDFEKAIGYLKKLSPDLFAEKPKIDPLGLSHATLGAYALMQTGETAQAQRILKAVVDFTENPHPTASTESLFWRVAAFEQLGDRDRAIKELKIAVKKGYRTPIDYENSQHVTAYPMFRQVRNDKEFQAVMAEIDRDLRRMRGTVEKRLAEGNAAARP